MLINRLLHDFQKLRILLGVGDRSLCELTQYLKNTKLVIRGLEVPELIFGRTIILKISHIYYVKPKMISQGILINADSMGFPRSIIKQNNIYK